MTAFGKVLTYINVLFAITIMAWSVSAYANRVDYLDGKNESGPVKGQISQMKEEIDKLQKSIAEAQASYGEKAVALVEKEGRRDWRRSRFQARISEARGTGGRQATFKVQLPMPGDASNVNAFTDLTQEGPTMQDIENKPLRGLNVLQEELEAELRDGILQLEGQAKLNQQQKGQLLQLVGMPQYNTLLDGMGISELRETHGRLSDAIADTDIRTDKQKDILANLGEESAFLKDKRVNWFAELQTLERRQRQLEAEIRRLGGTP